MANTRSAAKRTRQTKTRTLVNKSVLTGIRSQQKKFEAALSAGESEKVKAEFSLLASRLDKASKRGIVHRNLAARRKGNAAKKLAAVQA